VRASPWIAELRLALLEFAAEAVAGGDRFWLKGRSETLFSLGGGEYLGADVFRHLQWLVDGQQVRARDYSISHDHRWLVLGLTSRGAETLERLATGVHEPQKHPGGRRPKYDWDTFWIAMCDYVLNEGPPPKRAALVEHMATWCTRAWGVDGGPSESQLKEHVKRFYAAYEKWSETSS
jgi:hypothetical protein